MGEGYGCSNYHFTYSALAIKFIQLQASPIMMSLQYSKDRSKDYCTHSWVTMHALHVKRYKIPYIHACVLFACTSSHSFLMLVQYNMRT